MQFTKTDLNKTLRVKKKDLEKSRKRYKVDATGMTLWRLAVDIATKLQGKDKPRYCDFRDTGDFVVVENTDKIVVTWNNKMLQKKYYSYSGYKGNVKSITLEALLKKNPEKVMRYAVRWMLPKNKLRAVRMKRLKLTAGTTTQYDHFKLINLFD